MRDNFLVLNLGSYAAKCSYVSSTVDELDVVETNVLNMPFCFATLKTSTEDVIMKESEQQSIENPSTPTPTVQSSSTQEFNSPSKKIKLENFKDSSTIEEQKTQSDFARETQLLAIRRDLLVERKIISSKTTEKAADTLKWDSSEDIYFEEVLIKKVDFLPTTTSSSPPPNESIFYGQTALDMCLQFPEKFILHRPFWTCHLKIPTNCSMDQYKLYWQGLLDHIFTTLQVEDIQDTNIILLLPEMLTSGEISFLLDILFVTFLVPKVYIHLESVAAAFGSGISDICVLDVGYSKINISYISNGYSVKKSRTLLPFGMSHIGDSLLWILNQCQFSLKELSDYSNRSDHKIIVDNIREKYCHLIKKAEEEFIPTEIKIENKVYHFEIGDPLYIASLGLWYPKLFGTIAEPVCDSLFKPIFATENEKVKKTEKKKKKKEEENNTSSQLTRVINGSIIEAILRCFKRGGVEPTKNNKKNQVCYNILITGGGILIKGFEELLRTKLKEVLQKKHSEEVVVTLIALEKDNLTQSCLAWKGGLVLGCIDSIKDMWIERENYLQDGILCVREFAPFEII